MSIFQQVYSNLVPSAHQPSTSLTSSTSAPPCLAGLGRFQLLQEYLEMVAPSTASTPDVTGIHGEDLLSVWWLECQKEKSGLNGPWEASILETEHTSSTSAPPCLAGLGRFQLLQKHLVTVAPSTTSSPDLTAELTDYLQHIPYATENAYQWWHDHSSVYPRPYELALDVISTPASEAYVERIFSVSGDLSAGKRNRA